jgi:hypothetical protein
MWRANLMPTFRNKSWPKYTKNAKKKALRPSLIFPFRLVVLSATMERSTMCLMRERRS